jgi:hypothetical protein
MSTAAAAQGLKGAIVDGRIRDIRGLAQVGLPVSLESDINDTQRLHVFTPSRNPPLDLCSRPDNLWTKDLHPSRGSTSSYPLPVLR